MKSYVILDRNKKHHIYSLSEMMATWLLIFINDGSREHLDITKEH